MQRSIKDLFDMEEKFYLVILHFGSEKSKVVLRLSSLDSFLARGYVVEFIQPIRVLKSI